MGQTADVKSHLCHPNQWNGYRVSLQSKLRQCPTVRVLRLGARFSSCGGETPAPVPWVLMRVARHLLSPYLVGSSARPTRKSSQLRCVDRCDHGAPDSWGMRPRMRENRDGVLLVRVFTDKGSMVFGFSDQSQSRRSAMPICRRPVQLLCTLVSLLEFSIWILRALIRLESPFSVSLQGSLN